MLRWQVASKKMCPGLLLLEFYKVSTGTDTGSKEVEKLEECGCNGGKLAQ